MNESEENESQNVPSDAQQPSVQKSDAQANPQSDAHTDAMAAALAIAQQSSNAKPLHLNKKAYTLDDYLDEIKHDYRAENRRYLERYLEHSDDNFTTYCPYSSPVRDHRNAALIMWHVLGKYIDKQGREPKIIEKLFAEARKSGMIALENKFTTIIS